MPVLKNPRREQFAQHFATGMTLENAYEAAGYRRNKKHAYILRWTQEVAERIEEIQTTAAAKVGVTVERIVSELAKIAFANAGDYFRWGPGGVTINPSADLTADQRSVIAEVSETRSETGGSIKIKLSDKQTALEKLGRHLGMFKEKVELSGQLDLTGTKDALDRKLAGLASRIGSGGVSGEPE
jgi:phage terminase small subunit